MERFLLLLKMLPAILNTVVAVEQIVMTPKSGPSKLDLVVKSVSAAADATPEIAAAISTHDVAMATAAIATAAVQTMNAAGVFTTSK